MEPRQLIKNTRAVVLDFDGVIVDSEVYQLSVWKELLRGRSLPEDDVTIEAIAGLPDEIAIRRLCPEQPDEIYDELVTEKMTRHWQRRNTIPLVPGIKEFLRSLEGDKVLGICSSSSRDYLEEYVAEHLYEICFSAIISSESYSKRKPDPEPYLPQP